MSPWPVWSCCSSSPAESSCSGARVRWRLLDHLELTRARPQPSSAESDWSCCSLRHSSPRDLGAARHESGQRCNSAGSPVLGCRRLGCPAAIVDVQGSTGRTGAASTEPGVATAPRSSPSPSALLLALGRRSSLPVLRWLCTVIHRDHPRRSADLAAVHRPVLRRLLLRREPSTLPLLTQSTIVITTVLRLPTSPRSCEVACNPSTRARPKPGRPWACRPAAITRLLILPQALKAVIPAMVGQFISLFKDTSLLSSSASSSSSAFVRSSTLKAIPWFRHRRDPGVRRLRVLGLLVHDVTREPTPRTTTRHGQPMNVPPTDPTPSPSSVRTDERGPSHDRCESARPTESDASRSSPTRPR